MAPNELAAQTYQGHCELAAQMHQAPLLIGCDMSSITADTMEILSNSETYPLGVQAKKVRWEGDAEIWAGPLWGYRVALLLINIGEHWRESIIHAAI
ncbi:Alpha-galactosidase 1 [Dionaea muscipula]